MTTGVGQSIPFLRRLLLEDKILLFLVLLLVLLGGTLLLAQHFATVRASTAMLRDRVEAAVSSHVDGLRAAAEGGDRGAVQTLLNEAAAVDTSVAYVVIDEVENLRTLSSTNSAAAAAFLEQRAQNGSSSAGHFIEITVPLRAERQRVGTLLVGVDRGQVDRITDEILITVLALGLLPVVLLLAAARYVLRQAIKPLTTLTQVADDISTGNLDPVIDFGVHVNCWEIKDCQETECRAFMNFDQQCWYVDGTPCNESEPRFPEKLESCRRCEVYQAHRGDEIVQLADSFKHMTQVLNESREDLIKADDFQRRLIRNSYNGIVATDETDTVTIFNRVAEDVLGVSREQVIGRQSWREFFKDELERHIDLPLTHERFRRGRGFRMLESSVRRSDGSFVDVMLSGISLFERGRFIGKVFFFQDLREIKKLREDLIRSERLAATGQAAASISHAAKNILDGFLGGAYVFNQGRARGDETKMDKGWEMVERNMEIIARLVKDLLRFAEDRPLQLGDHEPTELIEGSLANAGVGRNGRISVGVEIEESRCLRVDARSLGQCLIDLIRNAFEAVPLDRSGHVDVRFGVKDEVPFFAVSDDGVGMSAETIEKVREGMYSTKGSKGTGLGLLVVQKVVREHGGQLTIESEEGTGSTFRIELPTS